MGRDPQSDFTYDAGIPATPAESRKGDRAPTPRPKSRWRTAPQGPIIGEIKSAALASIASIADALAPGMAYVDRHRRWSLNPTRPDTQPNSFCIDVAGAAPGRFMEFASGDGGDVIDFVSYCLGGSAGYQSPERRGQALRWLRAHLGLGDLEPADRTRLGELAKAREAAREKTEHQAKAKREKNARFAKDLWLAAKPWPGTIVETYLTEARGLPVRDLGSPLNAIKFEPEAYDGKTGEILPAMMTAFTNAKGEIRGVHTTFLKEDGSGKAEIERAKRFLGDVKGCAMRLHRGHSAMSERHAPPAGDVLAVSEGIENALSWSALYPAHRTMAAGAVDLIGQVPLPACAGRVIVLRDNDKTGSPAWEAAHRAAAALRNRAEGRPVTTQPPPGDHKDFNDYWRAG